MRRTAEAVTIVLLVAAAILFSLAVTDTRVLVGERVVQPGEKYVVEGFGDLSANAQASLVCRYFNGRKVLPTVFWHSPNNFMGRDSCPLIWRVR
jgi:hypothetical protein